MKFEEYVEKGIIKKISPNKSRARDLVEESERKNNSLQEIIKKIGVKDVNANDAIEYCYDILIGLIRAKLFLEGYKSYGEGAHESEVSYMLMLGFSDSEVKFMDSLRFFRNGIKYYGKRFDSEYATKIIDFMTAIRPRLKKLLIF